MRRSLLRRGLLAALLGLAACCGAAMAGQVTVVRHGGTYMAMDGDLLIARYREDGSESTHYTYISGLLWQAASSDGTVSTYRYDADGRLLDITTRSYARDRAGRMMPASVAGTSQQAIYAGGKLVALASSTGKRIGLGTAMPGDAVLGLTPRAGKPAVTPSGRERLKAFNYLLIGLHNWDLRPADWDCTKTPEGEDICTGHPPPSDPPYDPGPPPNETPPDHGGGEVGGGGGGEVGSGADGAASNPQIPTNLPTRASCDAAAHNTYWIMINQVCKFPKNRASCEAQAFLIYEQQRAECAALYPG